MNLANFLRNYAEQIGGQYTEYNSDQPIIIVPVSGGRFQTVVGLIKKNELYNRSVITLTSKVCEINHSIDYKMLLEQSAFFNYCRFIVSENHVKVEAVSALDGINEESIKEMIQEVANLADQYELKLTGGDVH